MELNWTRYDWNRRKGFMYSFDTSNSGPFEVRTSETWTWRFFDQTFTFSLDGKYLRTVSEKLFFINLRKILVDIFIILFSHDSRARKITMLENWKSEEKNHETSVCRMHQDFYIKNLLSTCYESKILLWLEDKIIHNHLHGMHQFLFLMMFSLENFLSRKLFVCSWITENCIFKPA